MKNIVLISILVVSCLDTAAEARSQGRKSHMQKMIDAAAARPSDEDAARFPGMDARVIQAYRDILGRDPDQGGGMDNTNALNHVSINVVRANMAHSAEASTLLNSLYQQYFKRDIDSNGLQTYTDYLATGGTVVQLRDILQKSPEGQARLAFDNGTALGVAPNPPKNMDGQPVVEQPVLERPVIEQPVVEQPPPPPPIVTVDPQVAIKAEFSAAMATDTVEALLGFVQAHPGNVLVPEAYAEITRLRALADSQVAVQTTTTLAPMPPAPMPTPVFVEVPPAPPAPTPAPTPAPSVADGATYRWLGFFASAMNGSGPGGTSQDYDAIDEIKDFASLSFVYSGNVGAKLQRAHDAHMKAMVVVYDEFFSYDGKNFTLRSENERAANWKRLADTVRPYIADIAAFYVMDEPYTNHGVTAGGLDKEVAAVKAEFPDIPTAIIFRPSKSNMNLASMRPAGLDWIGLECYEDCDIGTLYNNVKGQLAGNDKFFITPSATSSKSASYEMAKGNDSYNICKNDDKCVGLLPFIWQKYGKLQGVSGIPALRDGYTKIGQEMKSVVVGGPAPASTNPPAYSGYTDLPKPGSTTVDFTQAVAPTPIPAAGSSGANLIEIQNSEIQIGPTD